MTRSTVRFTLFGVLTWVLLAFPAWAQVYTIDYLGFGWETDGVPPSLAGDELTGTMVADFVDPAFGVNLAAEELTFHVYGLISDGEVDLGGGSIMVTYSGGFIDIYRDPARNAAWGINPPNATSPGSFTDGSLFFRGSFNSFLLFFAAGGYGSYEGTLDGLAGEIIDSGCSECVYTWGGAFILESGATVPAGYDMQMDGVFEIDEAVPNESSSWGDVKALFNN